MKALKKAADKFTAGEIVDKKLKRQLDFENKDIKPYSVKDIEYSNKKERNWSQKKNKEEFLKWFGQDEATKGFNELVVKYKDVPVFLSNNEFTIQNRINTKMLSDCILYYLGCLSKNPAERHKFVKIK